MSQREKFDLYTPDEGLRLQYKIKPSQLEKLIEADRMGANKKYKIFLGTESVNTEKGYYPVVYPKTTYRKYSNTLEEVNKQRMLSDMLDEKIIADRFYRL